MLWKNEAREFFGQTEARFLARRHGKVTLSVSRPKGQDLYPGSVAFVSNPWIWNADGTQGISATVGIVVGGMHYTKSSNVDAEALLFEGQWRPPAVYAPLLWISRVASPVSLTHATVSDLAMSSGSLSGWGRPPGNAPRCEPGTRSPSRVAALERLETNTKGHAETIHAPRVDGWGVAFQTEPWQRQRHSVSRLTHALDSPEVDDHAHRRMPSSTHLPPILRPRHGSTDPGE